MVNEYHLPSTMTDCFQILVRREYSHATNNNHFADETGPYKHKFTTNRDHYEIVMKYLRYLINFIHVYLP